ncbi:MAG: GIY-YIG nuclease family protein [Bacteroidales bacterium]|nr:GIY-YIG nuclease family protein [Bacteroidales bacterium]
MSRRIYYVYILTNRWKTVLYIGVTNNLRRRMSEHITHKNNGFTKRYNVTYLIYYETFHSIREAIKREKRLKEWKRKWKEELINKHNPTWKNLYHG